MIKIYYEIKFYSPWHCGSGLGGGNDADYCPIKDIDGFPFIPGKTIKGLFREASEVLNDKKFTERIFGIASTKNDEFDQSGEAIWSNAELSTEERNEIKGNSLVEKIYLNQYFTKINSNGITEDKSLRRGEYAIPMLLKATIMVPSKDDVEPIKNCMGYIKHIGLQRSRGFGRCDIKLNDVQEIAKSNVAINERKKEYFFKCKFLTPIVLNTTGATEGVLSDTLDYIPGANFLGIIAKNYSEFGEEAFDIFHSGRPAWRQ